jgi:Tfp pilus assembly protein PilN
LERLQAQIVAADLAGGGCEQQRKSHELLRRTLVQLTQQMKERWQLKQDTPTVPQDEQAKVQNSQFEEKAWAGFY